MLRVGGFTVIDADRHRREYPRAAARTPARPRTARGNARAACSPSTDARTARRSACNLAVSAVGNCSTASTCAAAGDAASRQGPNVSVRYRCEPHAACRPTWPRHRSPTRPLPPAVRSCRPFERTVNDTIVHVPDGERQRRQLLEVVVAQHLLAADVDRFAQPSQLGERLHVVEHRTLGVRANR